jgi:hypothetical protein
MHYVDLLIFLSLFNLFINISDKNLKNKILYVILTALQLYLGTKYKINNANFELYIEKL